MSHFKYLLPSLFLSGCSVFMAAHHSGVDEATLADCNTRTCLLNRDAVPIQATKDSNGVLISEIYQAQKPTGSAARAAMHGVLDLTTLGIWEIAGTPIEGVQDAKKFYAFTVFYRPDGETIKAMQMNPQ